MTVEETLAALDAATAPVCVAQAASAHIRWLQGELSYMRGDRDRCRELNTLYAKRISELTAELEGERTIPKDCDECEVAVRKHVRDDLEMWKEKYLALRAETDELREIERCKASIVAAGCRIVINPDGRWIVLTGDYGGKRLAEAMSPTITEWRTAERAAWEHAADPYRKRIEAANHELTLRFGEPHLAPVELSLWQSFRGEEYPGYPTIALLEEAACYAETHPRSEQWAEEHPADHSEPPKSCTCPYCGKPDHD